MKKDALFWTDDILQEIGYIEDYIKGQDFSRFYQDIMRVRATEKSLLNISEASRRLPQELKDQEDIPWKQIYSFGNVLRHDYDSIDSEMLWKVCNRDLAPLKQAMRNIKGTLLQHHKDHEVKSQAKEIKEAQKELNKEKADRNPNENSKSPPLSRSKDVSR